MVLLELQTGSRIHFGLMELMPGAPHCFAGLGVMLAQPRLTLQIRVAGRDNPPSDGHHLEFLDPVAISENSVAEYRRRILPIFRQDRDRSDNQSRRAIRVLEAYPFHCGLGTGTQLTALLCVARGLLELADFSTKLSENWRSITSLLPSLSHDELARRTGRGKRSGIGVYGFLHGNLVLDSGAGRAHNHQSDRQTEHYCFPEEWRFVVIRCSESSLITGNCENELLKKLASSPYPGSQRMWQLARTCCDSARQHDFDCFASILEQYLDLASGLFASIQGGKCNGAECNQAAIEAMGCGLRAVGQSSWGPTIFGVAKDEQSALDIAERITTRNPHWAVETASVSSTGAQARIVNAIPLNL